MMITRISQATATDTGLVDLSMETLEVDLAVTVKEKCHLKRGWLRPRNTSRIRIRRKKFPMETFDEGDLAVTVKVLKV